MLDSDKTTTKTAAIRWTSQMVLFALIFGLSLFLPAWRLNWWQAWAYIAIFIVGQVVIGVFLVPANPALINERTSVERSTARRWDRPLTGIVSLFGPVFTLMVAGLDAQFNWSHSQKAGILIAGLALLILGTILAGWALLSNRYFYGFFRVREEEGHTVSSSGPYRMVRHPGYLGGILAAVGTPLLLGSWWAYIPAGVTILALFLRTALEDQALQQELRGYQEYSANVRYRLFPWIW